MAKKGRKGARRRRAVAELAVAEDPLPRAAAPGSSFLCCRAGGRDRELLGAAAREAAASSMRRPACSRSRGGPRGSSRTAAFLRAGGEEREVGIFASCLARYPKWVSRLGSLLENDFGWQIHCTGPKMGLGRGMRLLLETV